MSFKDFSSAQGVTAKTGPEGKVPVAATATKLAKAADKPAPKIESTPKT